jgi:hypothetical protein
VTGHKPNLEERRTPRRGASKSALVQLGWPQFWLLSGILGGMLGLVALVFFAHLASSS